VDECKPLPIVYLRLRPGWQQPPGEPAQILLAQKRQNFLTQKREVLFSDIILNHPPQRRLVANELPVLPARRGLAQPPVRGLHSFTSQLNLSAFYGIGGARRSCVARVEGVLGGV
jgi:hypothetical protein